MRSHLLRAAAGTAAASGGGGASYVTNDLVFHIDAGNSSSYSGSGTTVYNLVNNHANDTYSASHSTSNGGYWHFGNAGTPKYGIEWDMSSGTPDYSADFDIGSNDFSIECWLRPDLTLGIIWSLSDGGNTLNNIPFYAVTVDSSNNPRISFRTNSTDTTYSADRAEALDANNVISGTTWSGNTTWIHYVVTSDASSETRKIYINNSLHATLTDSTFEGVINESTYDLRIGGMSSTYSNWHTAYPFEGDIAIVRIYNGRALSASEVTQNYNAEKARYGY